MDTSLSIVASLPIAVLVVDDQFRVVSASRPAYSVFGQRFYPADVDRNLQGLTRLLIERVPLADLLRGVIARLKGQGANEKFHWVDAGRDYDVTVSCFITKTAPVFVVYLEDQTAPISMQRNQSKARSFLEGIMNSLHLGLMVMDRQLQVTNMNRAQEDLFKRIGAPLPLLQAIGASITDLLPEESEILETLRKDVLDAGMMCGGIVEQFEAGDRNIFFAVGFSPLKDEAGEIVGMIRVCEDVTEKHQMEEELRAAERRASELDGIRKVIITLNHEVNNALMGIMGHLDLIIRIPPAIPEDKQAMVKTIQMEAEKIAAITKKLSDMKQVKTIEYLHDGPSMIDTGNR